METKGFYKNEEGGNLQFAPDAVISSEYVLFADLRTDYTFPIDGWHWFESETEAKDYFGIKD